MCDFGIVSMVIAGVSAAGAAYQARQTGKYNAALATQQAKMGKAVARDTMTRGALEEGRARERALRIMGAQRAALAAGGTDIGSGSALDILSGTAWQGEYDALTIRSNAAREAWAAQVGGQQAADWGKLQASQSRAQMYGSLLSGAGDVMGMGYQYGYWGQNGMGRRAARRGLVNYQSYAATSYPWSF